MWPHWSNMLSAGGWALVAGAVATIVALYVLKLRRRTLEVPSSLLWRRSIADLRANALWQRLRPNTLLWLQLLALALAALALARPYWIGPASSARRTIFLIDDSASMSATDVRPSRLDEAKRIVGQRIDALSAESVAMIVAFADDARLMISFTGDRPALHAALAQVAPTSRRTSLAQALRVAQGLARRARTTDAKDGEQDPVELVIASDGNFGDIDEEVLTGLVPELVRIATPQPDNRAIVAVGSSAVSGSREQRRVSCRVANFGPKVASPEVSLLADGMLVDAAQLEMPPGDSRVQVFDIANRRPCVLELRLDGDDALAVDDRAWLTLDAPRPLRVLLVTSGNRPLELALASEPEGRQIELRRESPEFLKTDTYAELAASGNLDLVIYDRCQPKDMPAANTMSIGELPADDRWQAKPKVVAPPIIDTDAGHPLMHLLDLSDVLIVEATPLVPPAGGAWLVDSQAGPLAAIAPRQAWQDLVLGFALVDEQGVGTNWPLKPSFPVFVFNLLDYFGGSTDSLVPSELRPGDVAVLQLADSSETTRVRRPGGGASTLESSGAGRLRFPQLEELGAYSVSQGERLLGRFAVNLADPHESDLRPAKVASLAGGVKLSDRNAWQFGRREIWKLLAAAALAILLGEWYIYVRRAFV